MVVGIDGNMFFASHICLDESQRQNTCVIHYSFIVTIIIDKM